MFITLYFSRILMRLPWLIPHRIVRFGRHRQPCMTAARQRIGAAVGNR